MGNSRNLICRAWLASVVCLLLAACSEKPDLGPAHAADNSFQRYEYSQAIASNAKVLLVATQTGSVLVSGDGGNSWKRNDLGPVSLVDMAGCPDGSFVGIDFFHKVWSANADGADWKSVPLAKPQRPLAVTCDPAGRWWLVGTHTTIASSGDHGKTWATTELGQDAQLTSIQFIDDKAAVVTGEFGIVLKSADGGQSWQKKPPIQGEFYPYATLFTSGTEGWTSGLAGQVLHTVDGGTSWVPDPNATKAAFYRLFKHDGAVFGVGSSGVIARRGPDGWKVVESIGGGAQSLSAAASLGPGQAIAVGGAGGPVHLSRNPL
jgi:photosystem II stability/assembly factor-like uncharacterized protein